MALKDWKKDSEKYYTKPYYGGQLKIGIYNSIVHKSWIVQVDGGSYHFNNNINFVKKFKTKSQALAYARAYMRKH